MLIASLCTASYTIVTPRDLHGFLPHAYLMLWICRISGSVALSEATKLPIGMFSILLTISGSGKKTGPSLTSRTAMWTVAVELGPYPTSGTRASSFSTLMSNVWGALAS